MDHQQKFRIFSPAKIAQTLNQALMSSIKNKLNNDNNNNNNNNTNNSNINMTHHKDKQYQYHSVRQFRDEYRIKISNLIQNIDNICDEGTHLITDVYSTLNDFHDVLLKEPANKNILSATSRLHQQSAPIIHGLLMPLNRIHNTIVNTSNITHELDLRALQLHDVGVDHLLSIVNSLLTICWSTSSCSWNAARAASLCSYHGGIKSSVKNKKFSSVRLSIETQNVTRLFFDDILKVTEKALDLLIASHQYHSGFVVQAHSAANRDSHVSSILNPSSPPPSPSFSTHTQSNKSNKKNMTTFMSPDARKQVRRIKNAWRRKQNRTTFMDITYLKRQINDLTRNRDALEKESVQLYEHF